MNTDLMILLNHISLNRDFLPNTWRDAQPILAAHMPLVSRGEMQDINPEKPSVSHKFIRLDGTDFFTGN